MNKVKEDNLIISKKIVELREQNHLSQGEFARRIDVTRQAVSSWEMGVSVPSSKNLLRICEEFNTSLDYMTGKEANELSTQEKRGFWDSGNVGIVLIVIGLIGLLLLPFLAELQQSKEMMIHKSSYTYSYYYIVEYPLCIILIAVVGLLGVGMFLRFKRRFANEKKSN